MSQQSSTITKTFKAETDLSAKRYFIVELGGSAGEVDVCDGATDEPIGTVEDFVKGTAGNSVSIAIGGTAKVVASAAITRGALIGTNASGKAVTKSTAGDKVLGIALEAAAADGDIIEYLIDRKTVG